MSEAPTELMQSESVWPEPFLDDFNDPEWPNFDKNNDEIVKWVLENKKLLMRAVTWNLCAKQPPFKEHITEKLLPVDKFHLYIVGTEECERSIAQSALNPSKKNWEIYLKEALGPRYVPLRSHTLQAIHIIAFIHESLVHLCSVATSAAVATGAGNTLGNKGAVGLLLRIGNTKIVVVNAHLSAHQNAVKQRNAEFHKINAQMAIQLGKKESFYVGKAQTTVVTTDEDLIALGVSTVVTEDAPRASETAIVVPPTAATESQAQTQKVAVANKDSDTKVTAPVEEVVDAGGADDDTDSDEAGDVLSPSAQELRSMGSLRESNTLDQIADVVIFMGDLNYRIKSNRSMVSKLLEARMHEVMLSNDQLR
jgi:hypothetical protein